MNRFVSLAATAALLVTSSSVYSADPAVICESGKLKTAGKYASCVLSAESKAVKTNTSADYSKCVSTFGTKWQSSEEKGADMCPGGDGDQSAVQAFLDACNQSVADALNGGVLPLDVISCNDDLATCDGNLATCQAEPRAQPLKTGQVSCYTAGGAGTACAGTGQDGELQNGVARSFTDNGDGTITDHETGLMWEKLSDDGSIHDKDTQYTWQNAFDVKIATLNTNSFALYNDWRLPNAAEQETLSNLGAANPASYAEFTSPCAPACSVTTCSCMFSAAVHWTSTTVHGAASLAWVWIPNEGRLATVAKTNTQPVRAVRGGA